MAVGWEHGTGGQIEWLSGIISLISWPETLVEFVIGNGAPHGLL